MRSLRQVWMLAFVAALLVVGILGLTFRMQSGGDTAMGDRVTAVSSEAVPSEPAPSVVPPPVELAPVATLGDPTRIRIPAIGVSASIVPTSVAPSGAVNVPSDITTVGWYAPGPRPGDLTGSAVIVGHRDGAVQGHGAFYSLGALSLGDRILVSTDHGFVVQYRIVSREVLSKPRFASAAPEYFAVSGPPRLTLITCGGVYDKQRGGYQANVIVTAIPDTQS
jgi:hypothetical protein